MNTKAIKIDQRGDIYDMVSGEKMGSVMDALIKELRKKNDKCRFISKTGNVYIFSCEEKTKQ